MAGAFDAKVDISTADAANGLKALRKEVNLTGDSLQKLDGILKATNGKLKETADAFTKMVAAQRVATATTKDMAQANILAAREAGIRNVADSKTAENLARKTNQEAQAARATAQTGVAAARVTDIEARRGMAADRTAAATARASEAQARMNDGLSNSRYLMYDVGQTYAVLATSLMAIPAATAAVAASYQKDFAQVIRVTDQMNMQDHTGLKNALKDLAVSMPVGFDELTRITQLGAQMGVLDSKLVGFTETTAKFVAVTGISADAGATLFGRLETSFTGDVEKYPDFFNRIGSAIAYVGAKTVATDPEIASMLNQIGSLGASAGMSAPEVTGLAAALASVRVQPELARGTLTRIFGQLNRDVAEGSPKLEVYGKLLGNISGGDAAKMWKEDPSKFFTSLIKGLNGVQTTQGQLTTTFDALGITASRDVSALTKLAVGYDVLDLSMTAANKGFTEGTALDSMSKVTFDTVIAKLTEMANAWKNLGDSLGGGALAPLAMFVDMAKNLAIGIDSLIKKAPALGVLIQVLMGFAAVTAMFLGFKAAQAFVMAGMIGFQQAASRGLGGGLAMSNMVRTLAQTMLVAKGATDEQSRALLGQTSALRGLMIALTTTRGAIQSGVTTPMAGVASVAGRATTGIKGFASGLLSMAGGIPGIVIGALALLIGHLISTQVEADAAGKSIAEAMQQGADTGTRAVADAFNNRKVSATDGAVGFNSVGQSVTEIARKAEVSFDRIVGAISKGEAGMKDFNAEMERAAKADGYKSLQEAIANPVPGTKAADLAFIAKAVQEYAAKSKIAAADLKDVEKAAPAAAAGIKDTGDEADTAASSVDKMTEALKGLNDEVFGTINAEADLQASMAKLGAGLQASSQFTPNTEGGRENIKNFQDTLSKARDYYNQLMTEGTLSAQEAATGYSDFIQGLIAEIQAKGGDTSGIENLAANTRAKFEAAIGGKPVMIQVASDGPVTEQAALATANVFQEWLTAHGTPTLDVFANTDPAYNNMQSLAQGLSDITGYPYEVVMDALTNPASEKANEISALLVSITTGTYVAPVDADTSAAIANVQNFIAYARTELAHLQTQLNGGVGLGDGEGSMSPAQKAQFGNLNAPTRVAAPAQVRSVAAPAPTKQSSFAPGLGGVADGYNKAADAAKKAGDAGKKAGQDMADGIDDATRAAEDYGNRLKTGLMSAYNQQYGLTKATDDYHSALNAITKKRDEELKQLDDMRDKIKELNNERDKDLISANKAKIEAGISAKYGEGDRQVDYENQAQTALDNAAAKQKDIDATKASSKELSDGIGNFEGYSEAAIANREALRNLETKMIDMIAAYAATGASQEQVRAYAQRLTAQFQIDAGQVWQNRVQVSGLIGDLGRYIGTINGVPMVKPTTVTADTGQAMGAIGGVQNALNGLRDREVAVTFRGGLIFDNKQTSDGQDIYRVISAVDGQYHGTKLFNKGGQVPGFASGGQIPGQAPANPREDNLMAKVDGKGMIRVRSKEFIQPQEAVDYYGLDMMNAIRTLSLPKFNTGGSVGGGSGGSRAASSGPALVELTAETIAAIQRMPPVNLFADSVLLAQSVNNGNTILASTGAN